jgi:hypothetical protein
MKGGSGMKPKYRVRDKKENKWVCENAILDCSGNLWWTFAGEIRDLLEPERYEVNLSTNLHDKNGREIYEKDILRICYRGITYLARVIFDLGAFRPDRNNLPVDEYGVPLVDATFPIYTEAMEVVGNIYENPEVMQP